MALPWAVLPPVILVCASLLGSQLYQERYLTFCGPGLALLVALASYDAADPSLSTATTRRAANLVGPAGATLADLLLQGFGWAGALPGVALRIVDPATRAPLPDRQVGEIWVRSPFNFDGYYNDAEGTAQALVAGWCRTGDLGYRVGDAFSGDALADVLTEARASTRP